MNQQMTSQIFPSKLLKYENVIVCSDFDPTSNLSCYCYPQDYVFQEDGQIVDENVRNQEKFMKENRGLIFNGETLVMKSFDFVPEYVGLNVSFVLTDEHKVFQSFEGTLIRMFCFDNVWYTSTHRKINAFKSRWASNETFGDNFVSGLLHEFNYNTQFKTEIGAETKSDDIFDVFKSKLDKTMQYMFLVTNTPFNKIVCDGNVVPSIFHVGTFTVVGEKVNTDIGCLHISKPFQLTFQTFSELVEFVERMPTNIFPGVIIFSPDGTQTKICSVEYRRKTLLRANQPSLKFRYLQLRTNPEQNAAFREVFGSSVDFKTGKMFSYFFDLYDQIIVNIAKEIFKVYTTRYIEKKYIFTSPENFAVCKRANNLQMENKDVVTESFIRSLIDTSGVSFVNRLVKSYIKVCQR